VTRRRLSRRVFLAGAAATAGVLPWVARAQPSLDDDAELFRHGVASGDPLPDRVIIWTRVTPPEIRSAIRPIEVRWQMAADEAMTQVIARGTAQAGPDRDYTVKVDAAGLKPGATYYYAFDAAGEQSPVGRTKTLPLEPDRIRLASISCANYPAGFFNVYRVLAERDELDAVLHLGDYIYEFADGVYGDGRELDRVPQPPGEAFLLEDYRMRYATYRTDPDLQVAHARHPFIVVWDDHESVNNAWSGGAEGHLARYGPWHVRQAAAYRAYLEWLPVRESAGDGVRLYRSFRFGRLADLMMLDTRGLRDRQVHRSDLKGLADGRRSILGPAQETWLAQRLRDSVASKTSWQLIGQQVMFAPITPAGFDVQNPDSWDGYPAARRRLLDLFAAERANVVILTGDMHSSWAMDVPREAVGAYQSRTGTGSLAVEFVTPAVSSPPLFTSPNIRDGARVLRMALPHLKYLDGDHRGYTLLDVTHERVVAEFHHVATVSQRMALQTRGAQLVCLRGSSTLVTG
jgi:alkaline phosphatase D